MIEALGMLGALAFAAVPASAVGKMLYRKLRRREREARREQAKQEQAEITALYNEFILKKQERDKNDRHCFKYHFRNRHNCAELHID